MKPLPSIPPETLREIRDSAARAITALTDEECGVARLRRKRERNGNLNADYEYRTGMALIDLKTAKWEKVHGGKQVLWRPELRRAIMSAVKRDDFGFIVKMARTLSNGQQYPLQDTRDAMRGRHRLHWHLINHWTKRNGETPSLCRFTDEGLATVCRFVLKDGRVTRAQVRKIRQRLGLIPYDKYKVHAHVVGGKLEFDC